MNKYDALRKYYGYDSFREGQEEIIDSIAAGNDTFAIMPTGSGKSICYQIPALMSSGIAIIISPLISLMKDQVGALKQIGVPAAYLNSSLTQRQFVLAMQYARQGRYKIIYVAPERLETSEFCEFASTVNISLIAVDEAHCVSHWGHDFRPSYLKIVQFIEQLPNRPAICAFTATATSTVRDDVINILKLRSPTIVTTGFDRKNLYFGVQVPFDKFKVLLNYISMHREQSGIIYCLTRKNVEMVCQQLIGSGIPAVRYHAGLTDEERTQSQDDFIYDRVQIIVATNAFGMGIDKSNVRYVIHYNMPKNLESYYQEAGRAGRDGEASDCILLYDPHDVAINRFMIEKNDENNELDPETAEKIREYEYERLRQMMLYCTTRYCLRSFIMKYFGDKHDDYCGNCSNCLINYETADVTEYARIIIGCVSEIRQRYGINMITEILRGSQNSKIKQLGYDNIQEYGALKDIPIAAIRNIINKMLGEGYLIQTAGDYPVIQLGKQIDTAVTIKSFKEQLTERKKTLTQDKPHSTTPALFDTVLFASLRKLRAEIAIEERVPPYVIFSDRTLAEMSAKSPKTKSAMLAVSGVGEIKFEKYGKRFINEIKKHGS